MKLKYYLITISIIISVSCRTNSIENEEKVSDLIIISQEQFISEGMELGIIEKHLIPEVINCNGNIVSSPNGRAEITLPIAGVIKKVNVIPGQQVVAGKPLIEITGNGLIDLQKDFSNSWVNLKRLEDDFNRASILKKEGVGSAKEYLLVESDYKKAVAEYKSLEIKIEALNLDKEVISSGHFVSSCSILAPIKGNVSDVQVFIGNFISEGTRLMEIVDTDQLQIKLNVFQKDVSQLKPGLPVEFKFPDNPDIYSAQLVSLGTTINPETKAIECYANIIEKEKHLFIHNAYLEAVIMTKQDSLLTLPLEALIKTTDGFNLLQLEKKDENNYYFSSLPVKTGRQYNNTIQILDNRDFKQVLIKGGYNIVLE